MIVENQATALEDYLADIIERLSIFKDIYSQIRIVQPIEKIAHSLVDYKLSSKLEVEHCCMFWETQKDCNNCISMRAYISKKTAFKIEIKDNLIYLIQALFFLTFNNIDMKIIKLLTVNNIRSICKKT